jgi:uncharacterized protein (TIGR02594 family)
VTLYDLALRFVAEVRERPGAAHAPFIQWCHESCGFGPDTPDEVAWCSSFVNRLAWLLRLPRSKSAAARSWLSVGVPITLTDAKPGYDVVILQRGGGEQPGPEVLAAPGHVGLFAGWQQSGVLVLGGNQSDGVTIAHFPAARVLGIRRLA